MKSGTYPMIGRICRFLYPTVRPSIIAWPLEGLRSVARTLIVVVFPAPLGPMKPKQSPSLIVRFSEASATSSPYRFVRLIVSIIAIGLGAPCGLGVAGGARGESPMREGDQPVRGSLSSDGSPDGPVEPSGCLTIGGESGRG